jgi:heme A synthase
LPGKDKLTKRLAIALIVLIVVQWAAGFVNVMLLAPVWMQLLHLFLADLVWITYLLMAAAILGARGVEAASDGVMGRVMTHGAATQGPIGTVSSER